MGNQKTKYSLQELFNYAADDSVSPPLLQFGMRKWNGSAWIKDGGGGVGTSFVKALTSASVAVKVMASSTPCDYVDFTADGGICAVGDSSVQTEAASQGVQLFPGAPPYRVHVSDLTTLYAAGATGARLCGNYF